MAKRTYDSTKAQTVKWVAKKFQVEPGYVRQAINRDANGGITDELRKAYQKKYEELKAILS